MKKEFDWKEDDIVAGVEIEKAGQNFIVVQLIFGFGLMIEKECKIFTSFLSKREFANYLKDYNYEPKKGLFETKYVWEESDIKPGLKVKCGNEIFYILDTVAGFAIVNFDNCELCYYLFDKNNLVKHLNIFKFELAEF